VPMRRQKRISCYLPSVCRSGDRANLLGEHRLQGSRIATIMLTAVAGTSCCLLICRHGKSNFCIGLRQINPTGKSLLIFRNYVKPLLQKYFASRLTQISCISATVLSHREGRIAIVTDAGRDAVDARASGAQWQSQGEMNLVSGPLACRMIGALAYGEAVSFWHPLLVSSWRRRNQARPGLIKP
jgi:hypothetical protein